jgi:hypothetical protein
MHPSLEKRDNKAYLCFMAEDWELPRLIVSYYLIDIDASLIPDNPYIDKLSDTYIVNTGWKTIPLYIPELPTFTEFIVIKPPRKNGYIWKYGKWNKQ